MDKFLKEKRAAFSIFVSIGLILLCLISFGLSLGMQKVNAVSDFDQVLLNIFFIGVLFLSIFWFMVLGEDFIGWRIQEFHLIMKWILFFIYYPLASAIAMLFRFNKEKFRVSFLQFQNAFVFSGEKVKAKKLMLLLPHCLQFHDCKIRITRNVNDCADCGNCDISQIKELGKNHDIKINIANGGTLARKLVQDYQPDVIIAVACHKDLTDGVRESWRYPVYAVINERPYGPCFDTKVDVQLIESVLQDIGI